MAAECQLLAPSGSEFGWPVRPASFVLLETAGTATWSNASVPTLRAREIPITETLTPPAIADPGFPWFWLLLGLATVAACVAVALWWLRRSRKPVPHAELSPRTALAPRTRVGIRPEPAIPGFRLGDLAPSRRPARPVPGTRLVNHWGEESLLRLIDLQPGIAERMRGQPLILSWPAEPVLDEQGYLKGWLGRTAAAPCEQLSAKPRNLDLLIPGPGQHGLDTASRRNIATWIGRLINAMHEAGWAFGTFSWQSFQACEQPTAHLHVFGMERARELGREAAFALVTPKGWADPLDDGIIASFEQDRYRYALLVHRLLLASAPTAPLPERAAASQSLGPDRQALPDRQVARLRELAQRANGAIFERPTIGEWLMVLDPSPALAAAQDGTSSRLDRSPGDS